MKKILLVTALFCLFSNMAFAVIEEDVEVKTSKATYLCKRKSCTRAKGDVEEGVEFQYTLITTSNSGKSVNKKKYKCLTTKDGATCKALF